MSEDIPEPLRRYLERPPLGAVGEEEFWQDRHISKGMLAAHLDPTRDAASRNAEDLGRAATWIIDRTSLAPGAKILDLGCGPGLYTQIWAGRGFQVAGVDISLRSLNYARAEASKAGLTIDYRQANYLTAELPGVQDLITMIYCDFGALAPPDQALLLGKVADALKPGGHFIFDVRTPGHIAKLDTAPRLTRHEAGFWSPKPHVELSQTFLFPGKAMFLDQNVILSETGEIKIYRRQEYGFTEDDIIGLATAHGFEVAGFTADLSGDTGLGNTGPSSDTLGVVLKRIA